MFPLEILSEPNAEKQRVLVKTVVQQKIDRDEYTHTEHLSSQEPMRSYGFEYLDGIRVEGTVARQQEPGESWNGTPVRLVHTSDLGRIRHPVFMNVRVPGTNVTRREKRMKDFGNVADVIDIPGERLARNILFQQGWPCRQLSSGGTHEGSIVEWRWLEREAALGDMAAPGVVELYERLRPRVEKHDADMAAKAVAAMTQKANPKGQRNAPAGV